MHRTQGGLLAGGRVSDVVLVGLILAGTANTPLSGLTRWLCRPTCDTGGGWVETRSNHPLSPLSNF